MYQVYVTDALKAISENTAKFGGGGYIQTRFYDILHPKREETRTGEEIVALMKEKLSMLGGANAEPI